MIECIFSIDYEIYGNGEGLLDELVYEPARKLKNIFDQSGVKIVVFVETAELEKIETFGTDPAISKVKGQIKEFYEQGHEIALHIHPQWCNARYLDGKWELDYSEYNLCELPKERIVEIVNRSITYIRTVLEESDFTPLSFRAGNWLFQPTQPLAGILAEQGIKVDSSVFKGGLQHQHKLDYRSTFSNGYYWSFTKSVVVPDPKGKMLEIPIHTQMVPFWKMLTTKRIGLQYKGLSEIQFGTSKLYRLLDFTRVRQPLKFDFCRLTLDELISMVDTIIREDRKTPTLFRPVVAIGHTKDLVDLATVDSFLSYLSQKEIAVSTFRNIPQIQMLNG